MDRTISAIDLFCGVGGLTHGLLKEGVEVRLGVDIDPACKYPYEFNNDANFLLKDVAALTTDDLLPYYPSSGIRLVAGCAPCQPFSTYSYRYKNNSLGDETIPTKDERWKLLNSFANVVKELKPELVTMENVSLLEKHEIFAEFVAFLESLGYIVSYYARVDCSKYGVAQKRIRMVLFASIYGKVELCPSFSDDPLKVEDVISDLPEIEAGGIHPEDSLHRARNLSKLNLERIRASVPGGSWRNWDESLITPCHKTKSGKSYGSVYGRMSWEKPSPTITTEFYGYGSGRFGHPTQDRAISLREGAILQSFPPEYAFVGPNQRISFDSVGRLIGNAVPVNLGRAIARSIINNINKYVL